MGKISTQEMLSMYKERYHNADVMTRRTSGKTQVKWHEVKKMYRELIQKYRIKSTSIERSDNGNT